MFADGLEDNEELISGVAKFTFNSDGTMGVRIPGEPARAQVNADPAPATAPAAGATAPAAAKEAPLVDPPNSGKAVGCPQGYVIGPTKHCEFEAELIKKQQQAKLMQVASKTKFDPAATEPEKIQTLIPEAYRTEANKGGFVLNMGNQRTTFYGQQQSKADPPKDEKKATVEAPEKVETFNWPHA